MVNIEKMLEGINLDGKKIQIEDKWYEAKELKDTIKKMIDDGEYEISKYAEALKRLETVIKDFKEIKVKIPNDMIAAYKKVAKEKGKSVENYYRVALATFIEGDLPEEVEEEEAEAEEKKEEEEEAAEEEEKEEEEEAEAEEETEEEEEAEAEEKKEEEEEAAEEEEKEEEEEAAEEEEKEEEEEGDGKKPSKVVRVACHNCKRPITITTSKRPITVICEHCGARGQLSS